MREVGVAGRTFIRHTYKRQAFCLQKHCSFLPVELGLGLASIIHFGRPAVCQKETMVYING